ncbi:hypothetical protein NMY22_g2968 [Coprinellus aureogranulatus]|nr:hypothetical protein NMY22_g2968 [Coprinellus aureogranulatus]
MLRHLVTEQLKEAAQLKRTGAAGKPASTSQSGARTALEDIVQSARRLGDFPFLLRVIWDLLVWVDPQDRNTINKVISKVDLPWHPLSVSRTIAECFKAVHKLLLGNKSTKRLAPAYHRELIAWILDDIRTAWKLPIPPDAPAKRPEKKIRNDENAFGEPTETQLRLHSTLFADMVAVGLISHKTFAPILKDILSSTSNKRHMKIALLDIMTIASAKGQPKIKAALWEKAITVAEDEMHEAEIEFVECFVEDAREEGKVCGVGREVKDVPQHDRRTIRCKEIRWKIRKLDKEFSKSLE